MVQDNNLKQNQQLPPSKNQYLSYQNYDGNRSVDSDGHDSSSFQIGNNGLGQGDESQFLGAGANNASQIDNFIKKHQDATLNKNHWVPDHKARQCFKCSKDFTFFYRKHHCRICGNVFCHNCTTVKAIISNGVEQKNVRMCSECEKMIENYNRSLKQKNNLIFAEERKSNYLSNEYNGRNQYSFHHYEDQARKQIEEDGQPLIYSQQDQRDLEKIRMIQTEIDNIDEHLKRDAFNKLISALEEEKYDKSSMAFSESVSFEKANFVNQMSLYLLQFKLKDFSQYHIQSIVLEIMKNQQIDFDKWGNKLLEFVSTAVDNVKPSSRLLNDSMNFNSFIKIKIINYADNSKSGYINGIVMSKNLADKRMVDKIQNPQILLLKDNLGLVKSDPGLCLTDISTVIDQEEYQVNIVKQKLTQVQPNIIIIEQDVSYKVLDALREAKITVITNMKAHKMKRVARYSQTIISPSYNVVDKSFVLGKCKQFRVERPYTANLNKNQEIITPGSTQMNTQMYQNNHISNERNLIYFEGCNPALGCTILLSGNVQSEMEELRKVKAALKDMLKLARNVVLERAFLMQIGCNIPRSINEEGTGINANESPFLITRNIQNRQTLVLSKVVMKKGVFTDKIMQHQNPLAAQANMANTSIQFPPQALQNMGGYNEEMSMALNQLQLDQMSQMLSPQGQLPQTPGLNQATLQQLAKVNENYVKTKIDSMCGCPKKEKMTFYQKKQDETIGNMLKQLCKKSSDPCEFCKEPNFKHLIQYYHRDGCIEIQLQLQQSNDSKKQTQSIKPKEHIEKKREIVMKGFCQLCNKFVTPEVTMSNQFYEYSKARFFEQFFYNGEKLLNHNADHGISCNHKSLRDLQRIFVIPGGFQITFTFIPLEVYTIEMLQPKTQDTTDTFNQEIEKRKRTIEQSIHQANEDLKTKIGSILEFIKSQKKLILTKEQQKYYIQQNTNIPIFIQPLKKINQRFRELEKEISKVIQQIGVPLHDVDTIFGIIFLERKVLVNFMTFSKLIEEVSKVACLLLVMLYQRVSILKQQQLQMQTIGDQFESSALLSANLESITEQNFNRVYSENVAANDRNTQVQANTVERATLSNMKKAQSYQQKNDYELLFQELFQNQHETNTSMQAQSQMNLGQSKQIGTQNMHVAFNIEPIKQILKERVSQKFEDLQYELINDRKFLKPADTIKPRDGSIHNNMNLKSQQLLGNQQNDQNHTWFEMLQNGFTTMPLGTDNLYVPLKETDVGSLISFTLASNIYKEAMIKQNYMDISSKIKGLGKHPRQPGQYGPIGGNAGGTGTDPNPTPMGVRESSMNLQGFAQQAQYQTQNTMVNNNSQDETIKLLDQNDVFNTELNAHQIETELLCGERLYFLVKFSTDKNDLSIRMVKNGSVAKLKQTSLNFTTGHVTNKKKIKKSKVELNDFQEKVCPQLSKDYLDSAFYKESVTELDKVIGLLNAYYFQQNQYGQVNQQNTSSMNINSIVSPPRTIVHIGSHPMSGEDSQSFDLVTDQQHFNNVIDLQQHPSAMRDSATHINFLNSLKSPPMGMGTNTQNTPQMTNQINLPMNQWPPSDMTEFCGIKSPLQTLNANPNEALRQELNIPKVDFEVKIYYPKKFEALRRFYCGSQYDFIKSLLKTKEWTTVSGGKTKSKFYRSFDDKYVYKEIKKSEFKMFLEFAPQYFDYLCKSFFHNYPCALCKILGAFKIKIITYKNGQQKIVKKYLYITENLNFGIKPEDEGHIIRYDLKGSSLNRFVKTKENNGRVVLHDNNFLLEFMGRPLPIRYTINRILHICINNDTLCLSKSNIVDYSLLTIIDTKRRKVRFGIIDYVQQYTLDKIFESKFKNIINGGEVPTIVDPEKYKQRFKRAMKRYFVGMCIQEEKVHGGLLKQDANDAPEEYSDDEDEANETIKENNEQQMSMIGGTTKNENIDND